MFIIDWLIITITYFREAGNADLSEYFGSISSSVKYGAIALALAIIIPTGVYYFYTEIYRLVNKRKAPVSDKALIIAGNLRDAMLSSSDGAGQPCTEIDVLQRRFSR